MTKFIATLVATALLAGGAMAGTRDGAHQSGHLTKLAAASATTTRVASATATTRPTGYARAKAACELEYAALENQGFSTLQSRMWIAQMINNSARHKAYITNCLIVRGYAG